MFLEASDCRSCALITDKDNVYVGVDIDTGCGMGFCAEHNAIGSAVTNKEYVIKKIVAVWKDENGVNLKHLEGGVWEGGVLS